MRKCTFALAAVAGTFVASTAVAQSFGPGAGGAIPDNDPVGISSTINVPSSIIIGEAWIDISQLTHTWAGDLQFQLTSPSGTVANVVNRPGFPENGNTGFGDSTDYGGDYTFRDGEADLFAALDALGATDILPGGSYSHLAGDAFSVFNGEDAMGDWTLTVIDNAGGDTGDFGSWTLNIAEVPAPGAIALLGAAGLVARRRRRA